ncbi:nucleoside hydrolase [uncultured Ferrimonas sp.]|uniref:nucleoside hydrolase n=1 Tax=uncultured Ferrimonas sp. TaxID=432640 RepID=UPI002604D757|nr:nucleoside hydrolase [uncultured Ferrimonas sp.]
MTPTKIPVLIDTDADFDDYLAILYLLKHPRIEVVGITVTGTGDVHLSQGVRNISNMLCLTGVPSDRNIPVAAGSNAPLRYSNTFPGADRQAADRHYGAAFPQQNTVATVADAQRFLTELLLQRTSPLTVLCIGGGTTWGTLLQHAKAQPHLQQAINQHVSKIVMMGGNLTAEFVQPGAPGNIQATMEPNPYYSNTVAEWNIFVDPLGAQEIIQSGLPITLVALNATADVPIDWAFVNQLAEINNDAARFLVQILHSSTIRPGIDNYLDFWDPLAASVIAEPNLIQTQTFNLRIEQQLNEEDDRSGMVLVDDQHGSPIQVALTANKADTLSQYLHIIAL